MDKEVDMFFFIGITGMMVIAHIGYVSVTTPENTNWANVSSVVFAFFAVVIAVAAQDLQNINDKMNELTDERLETEFIKECFVNDGYILDRNIGLTCFTKSGEVEIFE